MIEARKFRKKSSIEAVQWGGTDDSGQRLVEWTKGDFTWFDGVGEVWDYLHESWIRLTPGDWIAKGVKGEFYPIKRDVFDETYEEIK